MKHERFITVFTRARVLVLSSARSIHSTLHFTFCIPILILYSHVRLDLSSGFLPQCSHKNSVCTFSFFLFVTHFNVNLIPYFITQNIYWVVRLWSSCLFNLLIPSVSLSLLGPNVSLSAVLSNILSLRPPLSVEDQVSLPYKTGDKIILLHVSTTLGHWQLRTSTPLFYVFFYFFLYFCHSFLHLLFGTYF
jgi:hypothetical protein